MISLQPAIFAGMPSIKTVENKGEIETKWVYDVTIEPTENFISHGLVFHNTVSIAKAGIVATLNARTSVLAAANPRDGRWDPWKDPAYNINLPPTLLSRFDLIFPLADIPDEEEDKRKSAHILDLHQRRTLPGEPPLSFDILKKYVAYARQRPAPSLSSEAIQRLQEFYLQLRRGVQRPGKGSGPSPIPITPRQLEALVRLSEARARMALRNEVLLEDSVAAIHLLEATMREMALDLETGALDIDKMMIGTSARTRGKLAQLRHIIDNLTKGHVSFSLEQLIDKAKKINLIES